MERPIIKGETIWLPGFARERGVAPNTIRGFWFVKCTFQGPAIVLPINGTQFMAYSMDGDPDDFLWPIQQTRDTRGVIAFDDCLIDDCFFADIGITGPPQVMDAVRRSFRP